MSRPSCAGRRLIALLPPLLSCLLGISEALAGPGGTFAFESLLRPLTAPQTALGGLQACSDPGPEAIRSNPAGLSGVCGFTGSVSHQSWQGGLSQEWVGGALPLASGVIGIETSAVHAGQLPSYAEDGASLGSFTPVEFVVSAGFARSILPGFRGGAALHALSLGGGGTELRGVAFSVGLEFAPGTSRLAVALRNVGPDLNGDRGTYRLPSQVAAGIEQEIGLGTRLSLSGAVDRYGQWSASGGLRVIGPASVALLCGAAYSTGAAAQSFSPRAGISVPLRAMIFSYSYAPADLVGSTHHISLQIPPR
jgi:hypothetical protein